MASAMLFSAIFEKRAPGSNLTFLLGIEKHSFDNLRLLLEKGHKLYLKI